MSEASFKTIPCAKLTPCNHMTAILRNLRLLFARRPPCPQMGAWDSSEVRGGDRYRERGARLTSSIYLHSAGAGFSIMGGELQYKHEHRYAPISFNSSGAHTNPTQLPCKMKHTPLNTFHHINIIQYRNNRGLYAN